MGNFLFDKIRVKKPKTNAFNLVNIHRFSADYGTLYPVRLIEVLPGDKFEMSFPALIRMAPMANPIMSHNDVDIRAFFVPNRLVCEHWEDFITGGINGQSNKQLPYITLGSGINYYDNPVWGVGSLADYLGIKFPNVPMRKAEEIQLLPFKAYQKIYNDWYRDELIDPEVPIHPEISGSDSYFANYVTFRSRRFRKDYFTSARPTAQLGSPVYMDIQVEGGIVSDGDPLRFQDVEQGTANFVYDDENDNYTLNHGGDATFAGGLTLSDETRSYLNILDLRRYFRIQEWNEKSMRTGNRYIESLLSHWGVKSSDARLQRSEYIGGVSSPILISDIDNTSAPQDSTRPFGSIAGKGTGVVAGKKMKYHAEEHGYIIVLASIMPRVGYNQGVDRTFLRKDKFDYAWPEFAHIGEQEIYNCEIYNDGDKGTFGYQSRFAEYKSALDSVSGEFRTSLSSWIQCRNFANRPTLSSQFLDVENARDVLNDIFVVDEDAAHFYVEVMNEIKVLRRISKWSDPSII